jgi:hypothetical protein
MSNGTARRRPLWFRLFRGVAFLVVLAVVALAARCVWVFRDRNPGYSVNLNIEGAPTGDNGPVLRVGFGRVKINPDLSDPNRPVWVAGFGQHRAATKIHDDLWAVACAIDDGKSRIGFVALDAIGFFHDDVIRVRRMLSDELKLDYVVVCSTHNHSTPDLMGLWGSDFLHTGVDPRYLEHVRAAAAKSLTDAVGALTPAAMTSHVWPLKPEGLVIDTRKPEVYDPDLRMLHFTEPRTGATIGSIVGWADHPETPWGDSTEITADFPGYLRDALEHGVSEGDTVYEKGLGGTHLYINGAIGGLMTTSPRVTVHDPYLGKDFSEPSHDKARALGRQLAATILKDARNWPSGGVTHPALGVHARTFEVPLDNDGFLAAPVLGLLDRGHVRWKVLRTEAAVITLGRVSFACVPGEIYPEIVNGGIENPPGADFTMAPLEVPPIRDMMPGSVKFVVGLANDELGYLIPKSEWDRDPPYLYGSPGHLYGEVNSVGPEAAASVHAALKALCALSKASVVGTNTPVAP